MKIDEIESKITANEMTAAQVFTQMRQHCSSESEIKTFITKCREQVWDNNRYPILVRLPMTHEQSLVWDRLFR